MNNFVYILRSLKYGTRYVGSTENLDRRLQEHNSGKCRYTKSKMPWEIVYTERFDNLSSARKRELFLKSGQGRKWLDQILS